MLRKPLMMGTTGVVLLICVAFAQQEYRMLSVTEQGRYFKYRLDVSDWLEGQDFINLRSYYVPWMGEDSLDYEISPGRLKINGEVVGVDLVEQPLSDVPSKDKILSAQTDPAHLDKVDSLPNLVSLSFVGIKDDDLKKLSSHRDLKALDLAYAKITDKGLSYLDSLTELRLLNLSYTNISDEGLGYLRGLKNLRTLDLENTAVTDKGLAHLEGLDQLRSLNLFLTPARAGETLTLRGVPVAVSDEGLKTLSTLRALSELNLHGSAVTDAGTGYLSSMAALEQLDLRATRITDASVENLAQLKNLRRLDLKGTGLTSQGISRLHEALPECEVNY